MKWHYLMTAVFFFAVGMLALGDLRVIGGVFLMCAGYDALIEACTPERRDRC